jgi:hypothetical protein
MKEKGYTFVNELKMVVFPKITPWKQPLKEMP